jgi:hypothetical protein
MTFGPGLLLTLDVNAMPDAFDPQQCHRRIPAQDLLDEFATYYNTVRPHRAIASNPARFTIQAWGLIPRSRSTFRWEPSRAPWSYVPP